MKSIYLKTGLRGQLVLLFLLVALIPLLVFSFLAHRDGKIALKNTIGESFVRSAREKLNKADSSIKGRLDDIQNQMQTIYDKVAQANGDDLSNPPEFPTLRRINLTLRNSIRQLEGFAGPGSQIIITNLHRQIIISTGEKPRVRPINDEWWHKAFNNGLGYDFIEDLQYDEDEKRHFLPVALPIRRTEKSDSKVVGVLRAIITLSELSELVKSSPEADEIIQGIETFIINKHGRVIAAAPESGYDFLDHIEVSDAVAEFIIADEAYYGYEMEGERNTQGERKVYAWARTRWEKIAGKDGLNFSDWAILVSQPEKLAFPEITKLTQRILTFTVVSCLVVVIIALIVSQRIVTPIMRVARAARAIGQGDFNQEIPVTSSNEVGVLADEFNSMRRHLENAVGKLTEEEKKMTAIVNSLAEGLILVDGDNRVLHINPAAEYLLNVSADQIGEDFTQIIRDVELTKVFKDSQSQISQNESVSSEVNLDHDGEKLALRVVASPFLDENGISLGTVYVFDDITREKEIDQMKSDFISLVSHELRTPLTSIIGFVSFILDGKTGPINEKQQNSLIRVQRQSKRLAALISDLLDVSRIESGRIQMNQEPIMLLEIANQRIEEIRPQADAKVIQLKFVAPESLPAILGDEARIGQAFTNLIGNAIKFTPDNGEVTVKLKVDGNLLHVEVIDTGPGIPVEERQKIFEKFYQRSDIHTRQKGGSGLGLSITKTIVEAHGGTLWVDDGEQGKGSNFQFVLPLPGPITHQSTEADQQEHTDNG
jgi:PAS domain S-box-containing protein